MSKKVNESATNATVRIANGEDLKSLFATHENVSIRRLCQEMEVTYGMALKASRAPIPGQAYDPEAINWDALANEFAKRNKNFFDFDWELMNQKDSKATLVKDMTKFEVGQEVYLRRNNTTPYIIVYKTETHIVLQLKDSSEPQAWANSTFLLNGPSFEPRTVVVEEKAE